MGPSNSTTKESSGKRVLIGLAVVFAVVAAVPLVQLYGERKQAEDRAATVASVSVQSRSALEAAVALTEPCESAAAVVAATPDDDGAELQELHDELAAALRPRATACCVQRMERVRRVVAAIPAARRSEPLSRIHSTLAAEEATLPTLASCSATGVLALLEQATVLEQGLERSDTSSWRAYLRVREMDGAGPADLVTLLFPPERRGELAQHCIDGGLGAAQGADDPREALRMIEEVEQCAAAPELTISAANRNRVTRAHRSQQSEVAALQRREEREAAARDRERNAAEAQALRELRRDPSLLQEVRDTAACGQECEAEGLGNTEDCLRACANATSSPRMRCLGDCFRMGGDDGQCALQCR